MDKGHYQIKTGLPKEVKECWLYTGKQSSIHIVQHPIEVIKVINGMTLSFKINVPQLNIQLLSIRKAKN